MRLYPYLQDDGSMKMFRRASGPCVRLVYRCFRLLSDHKYYIFNISVLLFSNSSR